MGGARARGRPEKFTLCCAAHGPLRRRCHVMAEKSNEEPSGVLPSVRCRGVAAARRPLTQTTPAARLPRATCLTRTRSSRELMILGGYGAEAVPRGDAGPPRRTSRSRACNASQRRPPPGAAPPHSGANVAIDPNYCPNQGRKGQGAARGAVRRGEPAVGEGHRRAGQAGERVHGGVPRPHVQRPEGAAAAAGPRRRGGAGHEEERSHPRAGEGARLVRPGPFRPLRAADRPAHSQRDRSRGAPRAGSGRRPSVWTSTSRR